MYKEEELKRLHAAGYGQVGFNYESTAEPAQPPQPVEVDEPFVPTPTFRALLPADMVLPESMKQNAIIEKTAKFIALQGVQMEILIKTKQGDNPQFKFLNKDSVLHPYYTALIALVKAEKWPEKKVEVIEEKHEPEEYLHPSLATVIESAPSIPSIHYKPSADCDYTMLISKMRGEATLDEAYTPELAPGEVAPPGTEPLPPRSNAEISRAPVMYNRAGDENHHVTSTPANLQMSQEQYRQQYAAYYQQYMAAHAPPDPKKETPPAPLKSTGLSLMKNYDTDSDSDVSDFDDTSSTDSKEPAIVKPPEDVQLVIDKMAAYVARNGDEFAEIVRSKNDPRFTFLEPDNVYHPYYKRLMQEKRGIDVNGKSRERKQNKSSAPVSFSIKKLKEPDPILPKPALPYESSSDDDSEQQTDKVEEPKDVPKSVPQVSPIVIPPPVVYKIEPTQINEVQLVAPIETVTPVPKPEPIVEVKEIPNETKQEEKPVPTELVNNTSKEIDEVKKEPRPPEEKKEEKKEEKYKERERASPRREKKKHRDKDKDRKKEYHSKSTSREETKDRRVDRRSVEKEKKREREREKEREIDKEKKRQRISKEELENEIISLEDNSDDLIDLTGDQSDTKADCETEGERAKQQERRRRAAEFLKKVGVDPAAAALPTSSLASAMVDTLESLRKKKADEEDKRRRREKRRHRDRHGYEDGSDRFHRKSKRRKYKSSDDNEESDYDGSKKKKRKKDKQRSSSRSKRRKSETGIEEEPALNINLTNTLKELRTSSPTKELGLQDMDDMTQHSLRYETSSDEVDDEQETRNAKKKKENREYSEGEWSSDSEQDSASSPPPKND
ncbi:protein suppressor of white apricot-like isoform X2 [Galleria mellonella]|nr:protein suppressor of white apricot-like isoform X2 [Galleria mellonella]XP_052751915.1 protein suppressor of white apricot-like isoform X2 [Galleria mellonella]